MVIFNVLKVGCLLAWKQVLQVYSADVDGLVQVFNMYFYFAIVINCPCHLVGTLKSFSTLLAWFAEYTIGETEANTGIAACQFTF